MVLVNNLALRKEMLLGKKKTNNNNKKTYKTYKIPFGQIKNVI